MGVKERRERAKLETRDLILEAARELFVTHGYEGVSMRKVADKIEYSPTAIYVHFADKEALFRELCHRDFEGLAKVFQSASLPEDPVERLKRIGKTYVEFGRQYPNHYRLMCMTPHPQTDLDEHDCEVKGNPEVDAYAMLKHTIQQAIDAGVFRAGIDDAELISQTLWSAVHGVISLHIAKQFDSWVEWRPLEQRVDLILDAVLSGLRKEA